MFKKIKKWYKKYKSKWQLNLYLNNQCVKKMKVNEGFKPMEEVYVLNLIGYKRFFGTNRKVQIVAVPSKYKMTDNRKRKLHIEIKIYEGVEI